MWGNVCRIHRRGLFILVGGGWWSGWGGGEEGGGGCKSYDANDAERNIHLITLKLVGTLMLAHHIYLKGGTRVRAVAKWKGSSKETSVILCCSIGIECRL